MSAEPLRDERKALYQSAEARVNLFNIKCLAILLLLMLATESLTELGVFTAEKAAVRLCAAAGTVLFGLPVLVYLIHDKTPRREDTILKKPGSNIWSLPPPIWASALCARLSPSSP